MVISKAYMIKDNKITLDQIELLIEKSKKNGIKLGDKTTVLQLILPNGFAITESSSCVDPANYNQELGESICIDRIKNKVWELEGYVLQQKLYERDCL